MHDVRSSTFHGIAGQGKTSSLDLLLHLSVWYGVGRCDNSWRRIPEGKYLDSNTEIFALGELGSLRACPHARDMALRSRLLPF